MLDKAIPPIIATLKALPSKEALYQEIMRLGSTLPPYPKEWKDEAHRVLGCQSIMYLYAEKREGSLHFYADSDALISKGLAALLIAYYNQQSPEWILTHKPTFLEELNILSLLTPSRANGVLSLYQKMQQEAVRALKCT